MKHFYLEVTYRNGHPLAAYYYLPRCDGDRSTRTERVGRGLVVDYSPDGRAIGIEITAPARLDLHELNRLLQRLGQAAVRQEDFAPLVAA